MHKINQIWLINNPQVHLQIDISTLSVEICSRVTLLYLQAFPPILMSDHQTENYFCGMAEFKPIPANWSAPLANNFYYIIHDQQCV